MYEYILNWYTIK